MSGRHESIAGFATDVSRVNLPNGAAAAPRPSKAVTMIEQCMVAKFLVTKIAVGAQNWENLILNDSNAEKGCFYIM